VLIYGAAKLYQMAQEREPLHRERKR
jgi:hypothetical protein